MPFNIIYDFVKNIITPGNTVSIIVCIIHHNNNLDKAMQ